MRPTQLRQRSLPWRYGGPFGNDNRRARRIERAIRKREAETQVKEERS